MTCIPKARRGCSRSYSSADHRPQKPGGSLSPRSCSSGTESVACCSNGLVYSILRRPDLSFILTDFGTVLEHDPSHLRALAANSEVKQFIAQSGLQALAATEASNAGVDFNFPHWDFEALEVASVSDSSDCQHVGNGVPCRFYNHNGCVLDAACPYSHAPDEKSVRDDLYVLVSFHSLI